MRFLKYVGIALAGLIGLLAAVLALFWVLTEWEIRGHRHTIESIAGQTAPPDYDPSAIAALPQPVQRYFDFTFPSGAPDRFTTMQISMTGAFRRPRTASFQATNATQTHALGTPAFVFAATTPIIPGTWARVYDFYAEGQMEMRAKVMSAMVVVEEHATPELNRTSLRRWLIEAPLFPPALLPGGPVSWEAMDDTRARAIVRSGGMQATLIATFRPDGSLERFAAEEEGDLDLPYHGSGELAERGDYREVQGMMIPFTFSYARVGGGETVPFWRGTVTDIVFE